MLESAKQRLCVGAAIGALVSTTILALGSASGVAATNNQGLPASAHPQEVILNPTTDTVVSVTPLTAAQYRALQIAAGEQTQGAGGAQPDISIRNPCDTGDGCYYTDTPPYADFGFYGTSGTYHGSWPYRAGFDTYSYSGFACWTGHCSATYPPYTYVSFTTDTTGTAYWIS